MKQKILSMILAITMVLGMVVPSYADNNVSDLQLNNQQKQFSKEEILKLEPYISSSKGQFEFDAEKALKDGFDKDLVEGQKRFLNKLNCEAKENKILIKNNLEIESFPEYELELENKDLSALFRNSKSYSNCGGGKNTDYEYHWWGYSRYACDCDARRIVSNLNTAAGSGTMAAGTAAAVALKFPPAAIEAGIVAAGSTIGAGYWSLLATRIDANNEGNGVYIEMTWVLFFDITPQ